MAMFIFCLFLNLFELSTELSIKESVIFREINLYQYDDLTDTSVLSVKVPENTIYFTWYLKGSKSHPICNSYDIEIYHQFGSFPISQFDGLSTLPNYFNANRSQLSYFTIPSTESEIQEFVLPHPTYGTWFLLSFIKRQVNQAIKKITQKNCKYRLEANVSTEVVKSVFVINTDVDISLKLKPSNLLYRFYIDFRTYGYILKANFTNSNNTINLTIYTRSCAVPSSYPLPIENMNTTTRRNQHNGNENVTDWRSERSVHCELEGSNNYSICLLKTDSLDTECWHYLHFDFGSRDKFADDNYIPVDININSQKCKYSESSTLDLKRCNFFEKMGSIKNPHDRFNTTYLVNIRNSSNHLFTTSNDPFLAIFEVNGYADIGSFLTVSGTILVYLNSSSLKEVQELKVCLQWSTIPIIDNGTIFCKNTSSQAIINDTNESFVFQFPYPQKGLWYLVMQRSCYLNGLLTECLSKVGLIMNANLNSCKDFCKNGGVCSTHRFRDYNMASCVCNSGYRGITCEHPGSSESDAKQLFYTLLLTLSNLFFTPAIVIAIKRRRLVEALIYLFNMFFSLFYHACDMSTWSKYRWCMMNYSALQFSDFYCSLLSFWFTLVLMSRLHQYIRWILHVIAGIIIAVSLQINRHGIVINIIPILTGALLVICIWGYRAYRLKAIYPSKKEVLWVIPGIVIASFGLIIFAFLEDDSNYPYTHSFWHLCTSLSILFLLPNRTADLKLAIKTASIDSEDHAFNFSKLILFSPFHFFQSSIEEVPQL